MGHRAHVQTKRVIEYGNCHFNYEQELVYDWLTENGVSVYTDDDSCWCNEWEIDKDDLRKIPESAYKTLREGDEWHEVSAEELREFVKDLLDAPTGDYAYVSWF